MMARCAPRLIRPLLNGLNLDKVQFFQCLRLAEHSWAPASLQTERNFSSTHRLHDISGDTGVVTIVCDDLRVKLTSLIKEMCATEGMIVYIHAPIHHMHNQDSTYRSKQYHTEASNTVLFDMPVVKPERIFQAISVLHRVRVTLQDVRDYLSKQPDSADRVTVHFINRDGERLTATAKEGESLLEVVVNQNLGIAGFGACEGTLACSTCHLIFEEDIFQKLDAITDEELDMLDLAYGLTDTSRLGCQVCVKKAMDGLTVQVPMEVADIRRELEVGKQSK